MNTENNYTETDLGNIAPNPRGEFSEAEEYEYLDYVYYQGGSYLCLAELGTTIAGFAPEAGKTTQYWQAVALPGGLTPEYVAMHDRVVNLSEQVSADTEEVRESKENIEGMETNVENIQSQATQSAQEAEESKTQAAGCASAAEASRQAAETSEQNINAQVTGFDERVAEKTASAETDIENARIAANKAVVAQQEESVQEVKNKTSQYITEKQSEAEQAIANKQSEAVEVVNTAGATQTDAVNTAGAAQKKAVEDAGQEALNNIGTGVDSSLSQEGKAADAAATGKAVDELKGDLDDVNNFGNNPLIRITKTQPTQNIPNFKLGEGTTAIPDNKYTLYRYNITGKSKLYIKARKDSDYVYRYRKDNTLIGEVSVNAYNGYLDVPDGANWFDICVLNGNTISGLYECEIIDQLAILERSITELQKSNIFEVGAGKAFEKITEAVTEALKYPDSIVRIFGGTYDLLSEFGGTSFADEMTNNDTFIGIKLYNGIKIEGYGGVKITCNYEGSNSVFINRVSPFNLTYEGKYGSDVTLNNIEIEVKNCRYCVHDEMFMKGTSGGTTYYDNYKHRYKNVKMIHHGCDLSVWTAPRCIGGGLGGHGIVDIDSCEFTAEALNTPVDYHSNNNLPENRVYIKNSIFHNGGYPNFRADTYEADMSYAYVCNNLLGAEPRVTGKGPSDGVPRITMISFNNTIISEEIN